MSVLKAECTRSGAKRFSQWTLLMRKFSESQSDRCKTSMAIPQVKRSLKLFPTGSTYEGTWDVLGMSGYGVYTFPNGVIYEGEFDDGMFHGNGELRYPSGVILKGRWIKGVLINRKLIFADGGTDEDTNYCRAPDRRFTTEYVHGVQPAPNENMTAEHPPRDIPLGYYDTGDGFYDPVTKVVFHGDDINEILRKPLEREQKWIVENCRTNPIKHLGPRKDLYEVWMEPRLHARPSVSSSAWSSRAASSAFQTDLEMEDSIHEKRRLCHHKSSGSSTIQRITFMETPRSSKKYND
ncbi:MORN repeat-containing protein 5-like [Leptidea sinapis]|uniref:MORN repeat-containing protein 5-like n=1 Tax=Leptidea sinapis TaxID=189913 RepID=UPI002141EBA7|nr:MORN repeat-containing protein 5-like [Leptidea sinapis]XP_050678859.1 MORN repeat-containing protein 5-like [Leptidea sinapis]